MKRIAFVFLIFIIIVSCGCEVHTETVKQDVETIDELKTILNELDDEAAKNTVQELLDAPAKIEKSYLTVNGTREMGYIYNREVAPFKREPFDFQMECILEVGCYIRYGSVYSEKCRNGSVKIHYLTVFAEVDEAGELMLPLYLYAYNRVIEKRTGMLETYTEPDFHNSFIEIGSKH